MNYTKEFLAEMYGAYINCKVSIPSIDRALFDLKGVNSYLSKILLCGDYSGGTHNVYQSDWWNVDDNSFKLALPPLSAITDEHAIEVANIGSSENGSDDYMIKVGKDLCMRIYEGFLSDMPLAVFDYLRSKGYDCGFRHIPSLIDAGLAVDKTKIDNQ